MAETHEDPRNNVERSSAAPRLKAAGEPAAPISVEAAVCDPGLWHAAEVDADDQKTAYKLLIDLLKHDDALFWTRNQVLIAANVALLTVLGWKWTEWSSVPARYMAVGVCIAGFITSLLWLAISMRSKAFYNLWFDQLTSLESTFLAKDSRSPLRIFWIAELFFANRIEIKGCHGFATKPAAKFLGFLGKLKMYNAALGAALLFSLLWLAAAGFLLFGS